MADEFEDDVPPESIELRRFDLHSVWRVLFWGASATMAVAIVAGTAFSEIGAERLKQTVATLFEPAKPEPAKTETAEARQPQTIQQLVMPEQLAALEKQTRELTQTVRELTAERDRVKTRLASLEQNFDDITGAVKRQSVQTGQLAGQLAAQLAAQQTTPKSAAGPTPPPVISAPQTVAAIPSPAAATTAAPDTPVTTAVPSSPVIEASPPLEGPIPLPPMRTAALEPEHPTTIRELGVDVGGAASLDALRANWAALKANVGPDIVGLAPSVMVRQKPSGGTDYRLVLGPLPNTTAALRLCAKLNAVRVNCRAGTFNVERMAERQQPAPQRATEQLPTQSRESILSR
jgi:hypothetical protein